MKPETYFQIWYEYGDGWLPCMPQYKTEKQARKELEKMTKFRKGNVCVFKVTKTFEACNEKAKEQTATR